MAAGFALAAVGAASAGTAGVSSAGAADIPLATYRAVHDFVLDPDSSEAGVGEMTGRMVTEFKGSSCSAYNTTTRFVTIGTDSNDQPDVIDTRNITVEKADGSFTFDNETYENGKQTEVAKGVAMRATSVVQVRLKAPDRKTFEIPSAVLFPTEQTERALQAARAGQTFLAFDTYDGLDDGTTVSPATLAIGPPSKDPSDVGDESPIADAGFATMTHWPITVSYFDSDAPADQTPDYVMSALMYDNGILRRLKLNYGTFTLTGRMTQLTMLSGPPCP